MNVVKRTGTLVLGLFAAAACSVEPRVDSTPASAAGVTGVPGAGVGGAAGAGLVPGAAGGVPVGCAFDTRTVVDATGTGAQPPIEVITSRGRLFMFAGGVPVQPGASFQPPAFGAGGVGMPAGGVDLTSIPLYAQGPCAGAPPGACVFDTQAFVRLPPNRLLEYVTTAGRQWVFENSTMTGAGLPIAMIPRYQPICALAGMPGAPCVLDTRAFAKLGEQVIESITAYGRKFELDIDGLPLPGTGVDLTQDPRYATGPCLGAPPGGCVLETRTYEPGPGGQLLEEITSRGTLFTFLADTGAPAQPPTPMTTRAYWATGPCL